jgi:hypothetical protein
MPQYPPKNTETQPPHYFLTINGNSPLLTTGNLLNFNETKLYSDIQYERFKASGNIILPQVQSIVVD